MSQHNSAVAGDEITIKAMALKGAAPREWGQFVLSLRAFSNTLAAKLLTVPAEDFIQMQGRAQMANLIVAGFEDVAQEYEKIEKRTKK